MAAQPEEKKISEAKAKPAAPEAQKKPPSDVTHELEYSEKYEDDVRSRKIRAAGCAAWQLVLPASLSVFHFLTLFFISPSLSAGI